VIERSVGVIFPKTEVVLVPLEVVALLELAMAGLVVVVPMVVVVPPVFIVALC
jgi:hypothetical protein